MNTEHTTETWTAYQNPEDIRTNLWHIRVAEGLGGSMRGYCGEKRARLIAAAPDLLEALKMLSDYPISGGYALGPSISECDMKEIRSAIAKAEGKA